MIFPMTCHIGDSSSIRSLQSSCGTLEPATKARLSSESPKTRLLCSRKPEQADVKALSASRFCPWNIYKALCAYGVAGTFVREHELRTDLSKSERRELMSKAVSFGEEASSYLRSWSTLEMDILGGVANALFYQGMAEVCEEGQKDRALSDPSN